MSRAILHAVLAATMAFATSPASAAGDGANGARLYRSRCGLCHAVDQDRFGPRHRGVYGRRAAGVAGYRYSAALKAQAFVWNEATLDRWLDNPGAMVPGTSMFVRVRDARERADLIAYLRTLGGP